MGEKCCLVFELFLEEAPGTYIEGEEVCGV